MINRAFTVLEASTKSADFATDVVMSQEDNFNIRIVWTDLGALAGTAYVQVSHVNSTDAADWENITSGSVTLTGSGSKMFDVSQTYAHYVRVFCDITAGSGVFKITWNDKRLH